MTLGGVALATRWSARRYIADVCTPGHVTRAMSARGRRVARAVSRLVTFVQVGRIDVTRQAAELSSHTCIVASNHPYYLDPAVVSLALDMPERMIYLTARGNLRWAFGLGALALGPAGVLCVDLNKGGGRSALLAGIRVLETGGRLMIFPEGWANMDGVRRPFKRGVVYMARRASEAAGAPIPIVPVSLRYGRNPGPWITRLPPALQYLWTFVGFLRYRRGVTVVMGEPISVADLPADFDEATRFLEARIDALGG